MLHAGLWKSVLTLHWAVVQKRLGTTVSTDGLVQLTKIAKS